MLQGYRENGLDESFLQKALENSFQEVFVDESEEVEIDIFSAAVDFELIKNSIDEAEQFAKDYIDCEERISKDIGGI